MLAVIMFVAAAAQPDVPIPTYEEMVRAPPARWQRIALDAVVHPAGSVAAELCTQEGRCTTSQQPVTARAELKNLATGMTIVRVDGRLYGVADYNVTVNCPGAGPLELKEGPSPFRCPAP